jgi:NadR type nicotinamide-nucleotide adenylyltransferase
MIPLKIVLTGPESTGKSTLARQLAEHYNAYLIEEYARKYISELKRPYEYNDVELIARKQVNELNDAVENYPGKLIFLDTYLVITKVWFEVVYQTSPSWINEELLASKVDLFLLCSPDLPWFKDDVRENGGEMRDWLFKEYEKNLIKYKFAYKIVEGFGISRLKNAIDHVESYLASSTQF